MKDESRLRFLIVDDEQSIRRLCMTVGQGLNLVCAEAETAPSMIAASNAIFFFMIQFLVCVGWTGGK